MDPFLEDAELGSVRHGGGTPEVLLDQPELLNLRNKSVAIMNLQLRPCQSPSARLQSCHSSSWGDSGLESLPRKCTSVTLEFVQGPRAFPQTRLSWQGRMGLAGSSLVLELDCQMILPFQNI